MRFGWMLAAVAAMWGSTAQAVITEGGKDLPADQVYQLDTYKGTFAKTDNTPLTFVWFRVRLGFDGIATTEGSCGAVGVPCNLTINGLPDFPTSVTTAGFTRPLSDFTLAESRIIALSSVPEPATWAMMILGIGLAGTAMRRRHVTTHLAATIVA